MYTQSAYHPSAFYTQSKHVRACQRRRTTRDYKITLAAINASLIPLPKHLVQLYKLLNIYDKPNRKGHRKGFAYVSPQTLAGIVGKSERTIERWVKALIDTGLLKRKQRANTSSILYFQDVTEEKLSVFLEEQGRARSYQQDVDRQEIDVVCHAQNPASKMPFAYNDEKVERNIHTREQIQYSVAGDDVVLQLEKLGFDAYLAWQFVTQYGEARVGHQIINLCLELQHGITIRSYPRWLYRAIERDYQIGNEEQVVSHEVSRTPKKRIEITEIDEDTLTAFVTEQP